MFSLVWWVCKKCQPNQQQHVYKPHGIKENARTMFYSNIAYQHNDDEFVSKFH